MPQAVLAGKQETYVMTKYTANSTPLSAWALAARVWRLLVNRRQVNKLEDLSDAQLADIGLNRSDVRSAKRTSLFTDPSFVLSEFAAMNRSVWVAQAVSLLAGSKQSAEIETLAPTTPSGSDHQPLAA